MPNENMIPVREIHKKLFSTNSYGRTTMFYQLFFFPYTICFFHMYLFFVKKTGEQYPNDANKILGKITALHYTVYIICTQFCIQYNNYINLTECNLFVATVECL